MLRQRRYKRTAVLRGMQNVHGQEVFCRMYTGREFFSRIYTGRRFSCWCIFLRRLGERWFEVYRYSLNRNGFTNCKKTVMKNLLENH